jgi:hypothetical protein
VEAGGARPSFLKIYLSMWMGPRPYPGQDFDGSGNR